MELSQHLVSNFAKITNDRQEKSNEVLSGEIVKSGDEYFVKLNGSEVLTPIRSYVDLNEHDIVDVQIDNHKATVIGNTTSPSMNSESSEFKAVVADSVVVKGRLEAADAYITSLVGHEAKFDTATIEDLYATNGKFETLSANYSNFNQVVTNTLSAQSADIHNLQVDYADIEEAVVGKLDVDFANIDIANIDVAKVGELYAKSGIIEDMTVKEGHVTGELVGVTFKGDLIEGNTIKADKLVVKGTDGLYYKLNTNGETVATEQTDENSLNGSIITAQSVTADKIRVTDLVAFDATIGGYQIDDHSIHTTTKTSATSPALGVYMNDAGEFSVGDSTDFIKFYKSDDDKYHMEIAAESIKYGASKKSMDDLLDRDDVIVAINEQPGTVKIEARNIDLNGVVTANNYFKINTDGSIEAKSGLIGGFSIIDNELSVSYTEHENLTSLSISPTDGIEQYVFDNDGSKAYATFNLYQKIYDAVGFTKKASVMKFNKQLMSDRSQYTTVEVDGETGNIKANGTITANRDITAGGSITADVNIHANRNITADRDITANGSITANGFTLTKENLLNVFYPVGSIYMSVNSQNPSDYFGGTWIAWGQGRVPVGVGDEADYDAAEKKNNNNVIKNLSHSHTVNAHRHLGTFGFDSNWYYTARLYSEGEGVTYVDEGYALHARDSTAANPVRLSYTGESSPGTNSQLGNVDIRQPYITCYMWKRIA